MTASVFSAIFAVYTSASCVPASGDEKIKRRRFISYVLFCIYFILNFLMVSAPPKEFAIIFLIQSVMEFVLILFMFYLFVKPSNTLFIYISAIITTVCILLLLTNPYHYQIYKYIPDFTILPGNLSYVYRAIFIVMLILAFTKLFKRQNRIIKKILTGSVFFVFTAVYVYDVLNNSFFPSTAAPILLFFIELLLLSEQYSQYPSSLLKSGRKKSLDFLDHLIILENTNGNIVYLNHEGCMSSENYSFIRERMEKSSGVIEADNKFYKYEIKPFYEGVKIHGNIISVIDFTDYINDMQTLNEKNCFFEEMNKELQNQAYTVNSLNKAITGESFLMQIKDIMRDAADKIIEKLSPISAYEEIVFSEKKLHESRIILKDSLTRIRKLFNFIKQGGTI